MTTPRLILCPPTAAALDRLNDCRATFGKMDVEYRRNGDSIDYRQLLPTFRTQAAAFTSEVLCGAVYTDAEPDPRVAALEARCERFEQLLMANWGVNGTNDITPAMERTLHYARTGEMDGEIDPWPHIVDDDEETPE